MTSTPNQQAIALSSKSDRLLIKQSLIALSFHKQRSRLSLIDRGLDMMFLGVSTH
ncbi:hypothetical protein VB774_13295 [Pseudanabaena galeata UHCC 0370]|uniref:Uncharacterized protein n=1 Tax=Pseudanabaena galeata UHCC 0370 TaxID=3110310 RepID=A0ABU5TJU4_9CYAN|nr:hypothetical protein [Pseudanabaena galeata]MEA5478597.1 hypothetical protein [Pseudanabaena galeata UHCC 0370]